jgi:hypothetical protein
MRPAEVFVRPLLHDEAIRLKRFDIGEQTTFVATRLFREFSDGSSVATM